MTAQLIGLDILKLYTIYLDRAFLVIIEAIEQRYQRGLAGAGRSDNSHFLMRLNRERNVLQYPVLIVVGEPDVLQLDMSVEPGHWPRYRRIDNGRLRVQKLENSLR